MISLILDPLAYLIVVTSTAGLSSHCLGTYGRMLQLVLLGTVVIVIVHHMGYK